MAKDDSSNIVLIGMPGVGKSTVGVLLAKATRRKFLDTDVLLQASYDRTLQEIIDTEGLEAFCRLEEQLLLCLEVRSHVIATGGSAVYSTPAMKSLRAGGPVVYLDLPLEELRSRLDNLATRGVVMPRHTTLDDLYRRRLPLYQSWADLTIPCSGKTQDQVVAEILAKLKTYRHLRGNEGSD